MLVKNICTSSSEPSACLGILTLLKTPHGNFPVPYSRLYYCTFMECFHDHQSHTVHQDCCFAIQPIIVSNIEQPENGDKVLADGRVWEFKDETGHGSAPMPYWANKKTCMKIIVMPEQFTQEIIDEIIEGELKDGNRLIIDCQFKYVYSRGTGSGKNEKVIETGSAYEIKQPLHFKVKLFNE